MSCPGNWRSQAGQASLLDQGIVRPLRQADAHPLFLDLDAAGAVDELAVQPLRGGPAEPFQPPAQHPVQQIGHHRQR